MKLPSDFLAEGWCQRILSNGHEWCLAGAALEFYEEKGSKFISSQKFLEVAAGVLGCPPITWNDHPFRTQEEVVALARKVEVIMGLRVEDEPVSEPIRELVGVA